VERIAADVIKFLDRAVRRVLVVDDDANTRAAVTALLSAGDTVVVSSAGSGAEAMDHLRREQVDCVVLDLGLPDIDGFELLDRFKRQRRFHSLPVIVYTGREFSREAEARLRRYAQSIVVKNAQSPERLLDEVALFLHLPEVSMAPEQRAMIDRLHRSDTVFEGKKVLIVDDDVRNVFALASALEQHGMDVVFAENGRKGIAKLEAHPDVDLVLMDVMMPEMDGYETTRAIRATTEFDRLPIIALTAKAMKGDREKSLAAGASDYITKPVNMDQLLNMMRVWLHQ
jgi:CheY-like chemotaxis protein